MRRVILAVTGTIAGLVALLSFKSHVPAVPVAATSGATGGSAASAAPSSSAPAASSPVPGAVPTGSASALPANATTITGHVAETAYGPVQIQLTVQSDKIIKVAILQQPSNTSHDLQIGEFAFPRLISETLVAQDAKIDAVSGASYTSAGYISSLQSALDHGL